MLYLANWGTRQLAFRFPTGLLDLERLQHYYWAADEITLKTTEQHVVLAIQFEDEGDGEWIEGDGLLSALTPLREDILRGDLRALHLAYLKVAQYAEEMDDEDLDDGLEDDDEGQATAPPWRCRYRRGWISSRRRCARSSTSLRSTRTSSRRQQRPARR